MNMNMNMKTTLYLLAVISICELPHLALAVTSGYTSRQAMFIPAASPVVTRSSSSRTANTNAEALSFARSQMISGGYGLYPTATATTPSTSTSTQLFAKKKKTAPAATKKIQVKMLKHVAGTGQQGQVVMVTPAFFNNKLRPQQAAKVISDEEVAEEQSEKQKKDQEEKAKANELKDKLDELELTLVRKAGPEGHLFGGVGPKLIMSELHSEIADDFLKHKWVKVADVLNAEDGKKIKHGDIKEIGEYQARINLLSSADGGSTISAKIGIKVQAE